MPLKKYLDYNGLNYLIQRIPRTKIDVTFDDVFAGETVTCSMGTTTYTKTVPATEPYELVFPINELGTWTIATSYLGDDYGTTIEVTAIGQTATGHVSHETTPEGATVLPTDDIQTWLACANITDKSYTTLAEVLADRDTFETLIADSNACDYMARSTTWALAEGLVPIMTGATTPSGEASASNTYSSGYPWKAFNGANVGDYDGWIANFTGTYIPAWICYKFDNAVRANRVYFENRDYSGDDNVRIKTYKVQASNDDFVNDIHDLTDLITRDNSKNVPKGSDSITFNNNNTYTSYRLYITERFGGQGAHVGCAILQFYEADITTSQDAMALIGRYNYCSNALLGNAIWASAIANSDYFEEVLNVKVPKMTSNTTPSGVCSTIKTTADGFPAYNAFDGDTTTRQSPQTGNLFPDAVQYDFGKEVKIYAFSVMAGTTGSIKDFQIRGSNDNNVWETLYSGTYPNSQDIITDILTTAGSYRYYQLYQAETGYVTYLSVAELQFYGRASAQTNIIHSAANDTIYMLENGSQVVLTTTNSDGIGTLDFTQFMDGTYTLYSSVAKDPDNLSNDFSKSIRISKSLYGGKTEAYLMPDTVKTLYWYGYESGNMEDCISANGWTYPSYTLVPPTHNTNDVYLIGQSSSGIAAYATKKPITSDKINYVLECGADGRFILPTTKSASEYAESIGTAYSTKTLLTKQNIISKYVGVEGFFGALYNSVRLYALWYE